MAEAEVLEVRKIIKETARVTYLPSLSPKKSERKILKKKLVPKKLLKSVVGVVPRNNRKQKLGPI